MDEPLTTTATVDTEEGSSGELQTLFAERPAEGLAARDRIGGVVIGTLVALAARGATPLVLFPGQPTSAAQPARATFDLHAAHIGRQMVLVFDQGDPCRPIVIGCLHEPHATGVSELPAQATIDADGDRLVVSARDQLVLRCGKASVTLTKEGKVIIQGAYVSNQSSGVLRLKGGSVQIN